MKKPSTRRSGTAERRVSFLISLQDLRRRIYVKAKTDMQHRFWGLYVHVCKMETLREAYRAAKANNGAPGIDGRTRRGPTIVGRRRARRYVRDRRGGGCGVFH